MDITAIFIAAGLVGGIGLFVGLFLGFSGKALRVETNELELKIRECLPSNNCGGCGFASCDALAKAVAEGKAPANGCVVGGAPVAEAIAALTGDTAGETEKKVAHVKCGGDCTSAPRKSVYTGIQDCRAAALSPSKSGKGCTYGCMGLGSCVSVCPQNAITVVNGVVVVEPSLCLGCGECARVCPNSLIEIITTGKSTPLVGCSSPEKLKAVKEVCSAGCIGCGVCAKLCPSKAITMEKNLPVINASLCTGCGTCVSKCPSGALKLK